MGPRLSAGYGDPKRLLDMAGQKKPVSPGQLGETGILGLGYVGVRKILFRAMCPGAAPGFPVRGRLAA